MDSGFSLLVKYFSQQLSVNERQKLEEWRISSAENSQLFSEVSKLKMLKEYTKCNTVAENSLALFRVQKKIRRRTSLYRFRNILKYAAVAVIIISLSLFARTQFTAGKYTTIVVAGNESVKKVDLEDGSTVWLAQFSELRIPVSFSSEHRQVSLKGKAYFDVKKNPESPFVVTSPYVNVKVTGTSFDLFVDDEGRCVETILASGKVVLQDNRKKDVFEMSPGEKVVYNAENNRYSVSTVDVNTLTSWHLDQIKFENATLREIVNKLSLIYDININLESKKLADRRYRYVINREESLKEVLDILSFLAPIDYSIEGSEVFITEKRIMN